MIGSVRVAFSFLTRLPLARSNDSAADVSRSVVWFPFVGAVVGAVVGGVYVGLGLVTEPLVAAAVAVTVGVLVTGGFHEDGLGDVADGFGGGWDRRQRLEIMNDSRLGTYGVLAIACSLLIRVAALSALSGGDAVVVVVGAHLLARNWAMVALGFSAAARSQGLGALSARPGARRTTALAAAGWLVVAVVALGPWRGAIMALVGSLATLATVGLARRKIGGVTGDVAGAIEQVAEGSALVAGGVSPLA